jgi:hypothetical protein
VFCVEISKNESVVPVACVCECANLNVRMLIRKHKVICDRLPLNVATGRTLVKTQKWNTSVVVCCLFHRRFHLALCSCSPTYNVTTQADHYKLTNSTFTKPALTAMNTFRSFLIALFVASASAFTIAPALCGGSSFVVSHGPQQQHQQAADVTQHARRSDMQMGSMAKFGIFSPAVYAAKFVLGQDKLNKIRGKAIALHSEKISEFSEWVGAYHLRTKLIKKAKTNGDVLGFLV